MALIQRNLLENDSLCNRCVREIVSQSNQHEKNIEGLPAGLKDKILHLMCKRGAISDQNISYMLHDKVLQLDLSECDITDSSLQIVASKCSNLRKLDVNSVKESKTSITSTGICALVRGCRFLQVLYMRRCLNVDDEAVMTLAQCCPMLRELNIGGCSLVTDAGVNAIGSGCNYLSCLNISHSKATDNGIMELVNGACCSTLKELHLDHCTMLSDDAVEAVLQFCPNIRILLFHGCPNITERCREALEGMLGPLKMKQVTWTIY